MTTRTKVTLNTVFWLGYGAACLIITALIT